MGYEVLRALAVERGDQLANDKTFPPDMPPEVVAMLKATIWEAWATWPDHDQAERGMAEDFWLYLTQS
jgi:hypothetical protein